MLVRPRYAEPSRRNRNAPTVSSVLTDLKEGGQLTGEWYPDAHLRNTASIGPLNHLEEVDMAEGIGSDR